MSVKNIILYIVLLICSVDGLSQERDTNYIEPYNKMITGRAFLSRKYTIFGIKGSQDYKMIQYRPNTNWNVGIGATYRALTINLGIGLPNNADSKGKTRYIDLQTHLYGAKWAYDLFGQFYRGYFIYPRGYASADPNTFYQRPDVHVREMGLSAFYIFNNKRFSYRAAFLQSEWQKKSAGSFLLGGSIVLGNNNADSSFVPSSLADFYPQKDIKRLRYIELGPSGGYAYTFVYKEHFYATSSFTVSADLGFVKEMTETGKKHSVHISPNFIFRAGLGYNSSNWNANVSWVMSRTSLKGQFSDGRYNVNTGNYRFTIARRFHAKRGVRKVLNVVDRVLD